MSRPGMYIHLLPGKSRWKAKIFPCFLRIRMKESTGRARCVNLWLRNKNGRNLSFFTGVSEFDCWARCASWAAGDPGLWVRELFREFSGVFKEFRGALIQLTRSGRPGDCATYPQLIHNLVYIREFGSLK